MRKGTTMKTITLPVLLLSLLLMPPVLAQGIHRMSASGDIPVSAARQQADALTDQGEALLSAGNYPAAEQAFRTALAVAEPGNLGWNPSAERGLAEALAAQGKIEESLQMYREVTRQYPDRMSSVAQDNRTLMRFAILLSQTGQWGEAVAVYEKALSKAVYGGTPKLDVHFDPQVPMPNQLQAMAHVAVGMEYMGHNGNKEAFTEFDQALQLQPEVALTNYYYGFGWRRLERTSPMKAANAQRAKAALQKAAALDQGEVKKAAQEALRGL